MKKAKALVQVFGVCLALSGQAYSQTFSVYRIGKPQGATRVGTYGLNDKTMVMMYVDGLAGLWSAARGYELFHLDHPEWGAECRSISEDGKVLFEHYDPNIFDFAGYVWTHETDSVRLPRIRERHRHRDALPRDIPDHLEVQVRPRRVPRVADDADRLALRHALALRDIDRVQVAVQRLDAALTHDHDVETV